MSATRSATIDTCEGPSWEVGLGLHREPLTNGSLTGVGSSIHLTIGEDGKKSLRAADIPEDAEPPADIEIALEVIRSADFRAAVKVFPRNEITARDTRGGAPAHQPDFILYLLLILTSRLGSQRAAVRFLRTSPTNWRAVRKALRRAFPEYTIPLNPPKRSHLQHFNQRVKSPQGAVWIARIRKIQREHAIRRAQRLGLLPNEAAFSHKHIDLRQWVASDGTVFAPPSKRRRMTREGQHIDEASGYHIKNGTDREFGTQFALVNTRTLDRYSRVILDVQHVAPLGPKKTRGNEGAAIHEMVCELKDEVPGIRGLVVDSIIRGNRLVDLAERGVHVVNYPHAESNPNRSADQRMAPGRVEKSHKIVSVKHERRNGRTCVHDVYAEGGQILTSVMNSRGQTTMMPLEVVKYEERQSRNGKYKYYFVVKIPCAHGDVEQRIGLFHTADGELEFNRGEYLRLYAPGSEPFNVLYGRRNDTENSHANFKSRMPRMRAYGAQMQTMVMLGLMLQENVVNDYVTRRAAQLRRSSAS